MPFKSINEMTLEEKIGQMVMFGVKGYHVDEEMKTLIQQYKVGNIIYFKRNVKDSKQLFTLNKTLQSISDIPLFIGIDQEGGLVTAIDDITPLPGAMSASAANDLEAYEKACSNVGCAMKHLGINMNFAPVADINNNKENPVINSRSYGDDVKQVTTYMHAAIRGFKKANIIATAKHFPGHGDTAVDSHLGLPISNFISSRFDHVELSPFKSAIQANVPAIMSAHIVVKNIDENNPATLSKDVMHSLLRKRLKFNGLCITDLLNMHAIKDHYDIKTSIKKAVNATNDILLYDAPTLKDYETYLKTFKNLVINNEISIERVNESVERILFYKNEYNVGTMAESFDDVKDFLNEEKANKNASTITNQSITLVKDTFKKLPLNYDKTLIIFPDVEIYSLVDYYNDTKETYASYLKRAKGVNIKQILMSEKASEGVINVTISKTKHYEKVIVFTHNAIFSKAQQTLLRKIDKEKLIMVALRAPYDVSLVGQGAALCAYEATSHAFKAIDLVLSGEIKPTGKLPVTL